jgi:SAM-dependent methyltransferase
MTQAANSDFENVSCVLCGSNDHDLLCTHGQHNLPAYVVLCKNCGLGFLNPRWTESRYSKFYATEYDKYYRTYLVKKGESVVSNTVIPQTVPAFVRMKNAGIMPDSIRAILDIGSGSGGFIQQARTVFPSADYFAIEPSHNCQEVLRSINVALVSDNVNSAWDETFKGKFDFINMRHVLEHFLDPLSVLKKVRETLITDGLVCIAVPNSGKPGLPLLSYFFRAVHTYYFNRSTLVALAARAGLEPVLIIEGDKFNQHELVIVCSKGDFISETPSVYSAQKQIFLPFIRHERSLGYKLKQAVRRVLGKGTNNTAD